MTATLEAPNPAVSVTLAALFVEFLKTSLCAFGGGLVWMRRTIVDRQRWLSDAEFADILSLCQFMPGPNIASIAVCVGARLRGGKGAVAALAGFTVIPWIVGFLDWRLAPCPRRDRVAAEHPRRRLGDGRGPDHRDRDQAA